VSESPSYVHVIAGPTASGKSALALDRAAKENGVIINADSLQLYDALPILTARPSAEDMAAAPHRLYGIMAPHQAATAILWRDLALAEIRAVLHQGQTPILVGGTGFYIKTLIEGLSPVPEVPDEIRILGEDLMDRIGVPAFFEAFREKDPEMAAKLDPHNRQRLIRAWEVLAHTGKSLAWWQSLPKQEAPSDLIFDITLVMPERETLYDRCNRRFEAMIEHGVVDEVRAFDDLIMAGKVPFDSPATKALGFEALQSHVRGDIPLETAIVLAQNDTRHYAKRQTTWFRHQLTEGANIAQITVCS
jgi:tRNA dimethylallyltransferase